MIAALYWDWIDPNDHAHNAVLALRVAPIFAVTLIMVLVVCWRWVPQVQKATFPYLGGHWVGFVRFPENDGEGCRAVTLDVNHTLLGLKLVLDSDESTSWTLAVQADRNPDFDRFRLFYIFLNERKEGVPGARERYRGVAIMRVETGKTPRLFGDYFTETDRKGRLELTAQKPHPWWRIWQ
jgi:hypothetical protein